MTETVGLERKQTLVAQLRGRVAGGDRAAAVRIAKEIRAEWPEAEGEVAGVFAGWSGGRKVVAAIWRGDVEGSSPFLLGEQTGIKSEGIKSEGSEETPGAPAAEEGVGAFVDDEEDLDANPAVLRYKAPYENARAFARRCCYQEGFLAVRYWREEFWRWNGLTYAPLGAQTVRDMVYKFLSDALVRIHSEEGPKLSKFDVNQHYVNQLIDGLKSGVGLSADWYPPMWLDSRERAHEVIMFANGALDIRTEELWKPTPMLWVHGSVGYKWDPAARCPVWERFLEEIHPGDGESWQAIDEMNGVCMTQDTRFEKGWALIGETRGGKGTLIKLLERLVGSTCFVSVSFNDWMKGKALQSLLGKTVIALPDVRLRPGKWYGANFDPGGLDSASVELLLKITSGDKVSIPQMYDEEWKGKLPGKVVLASNQVPNFNDPVLPDRFIKLLFGQSFKDREDVTLLGQLTAELPGIAARAMKAYWQACARGRVIQPQTGLELKDAIEEEADPFLRFVRETFVIDPKGEVEVSGVWLRWEDWCLKNGRGDLLRSINKNGGIKHLRRVPGLMRIRRVRPHGEKYKYTMLRWKVAGK